MEKENIKDEMRQIQFESELETIYKKYVNFRELGLVEEQREMGRILDFLNIEYRKYKKKNKNKN